MAFAKPQYSRKEVNKAGHIIARPDTGVGAPTQLWAEEVLTNWRASHAYPINTFQSTLRDKLERIDPQALVAQRLKRRPSIIAKLQRFEKMELARMQDIGGLRAVVSTVPKVRALDSAYRAARFAHELHHSKNYIDDPKKDGYRGIHLIYRYRNEKVSEYDGLSIELQLRTRAQHAWATAVETLGTFLGQALKSGVGQKEWRDFFSTAGAAFAMLEKTSPVPGFETMSAQDVYSELAKAEHKLG